MFNIIIDKFKMLYNQNKFWPKILIGGALSYIPILGHSLVFGYIMDILEDIKNNKELELPEWTNIERLFFEGLPLMLYSLGIGVTSLIISLLLQTLPCFGQLLSTISSIVIAVFAPLLMIIFAFHLKKLHNWKEAININTIIYEIQNNVMEYLPLLACYIIAITISIIIGCCGILAPLLLFPISIVFFSLLAEKYLDLHSDLKINSSSDNINE